ncbi:MAG: hypothetical protein J6O53_02125 [Eubacterium sp.]|nr:hypothetical protein [Eubacterium sp.]
MSFLLVNVISLIMFILSIVLIIFVDNAGIGIVFAALWLIYTIAANMYLLTQKDREARQEEKRRKEAPLDRMRNSDKGGLFRTESADLLRQYNSILSREEYMKTTTESMQDLYAKILEQAASNIESAAAYMESYDYYTRPEPVYLHNLCKQGEVMVAKFNLLVEQLVDIDTNPTSLDMNYVDDVMNCLQEMQSM